MLIKKKPQVMQTPFWFIGSEDISWCNISGKQISSWRHFTLSLSLSFQVEHRVTATKEKQTHTHTNTTHPETCSIGKVLLLIAKTKDFLPIYEYLFVLNEFVMFLNWWNFQILVEICQFAKLSESRKYINKPWADFWSQNRSISLTKYNTN